MPGSSVFSGGPLRFIVMMRSILICALPSPLYPLVSTHTAPRHGQIHFLSNEYHGWLLGFLRKTGR